MSTTFLTKEEMHELTGYKAVRKQVITLIAKNIPFSTNGIGQPVVMRDALVEFYTGNKSRIDLMESYIAPDFDALRKLQNASPKKTR
jgi:hypothetical protein